MNFNPFVILVVNILELFKDVVILRVIMSWLVGFRILNLDNKLVAIIHNAAYRLTEPVLSKARKLIPDLGGIDISPIIVFLLINFIDSMLMNYLYVMHL